MNRKNRKNRRRRLFLVEKLEGRCLLAASVVDLGFDGWDLGLKADGTPVVVGYKLDPDTGVTIGQIAEIPAGTGRNDVSVVTTGNLMNDGDTFVYAVSPDGTTFGGGESPSADYYQGFLAMVSDPGTLQPLDYALVPTAPTRYNPVFAVANNQTGYGHSNGGALAFGGAIDGTSWQLPGSYSLGSANAVTADGNLQAGDIVTPPWVASRRWALQQRHQPRPLVKQRRPDGAGKRRR